MTAPSPRTATPARSSLWTVSERLSSLALPATDFFQHAGKTVHAVRCLRFRPRCCPHMQRAHTAGRNPEQYLLLADRDQYQPLLHPETTTTQHPTCAWRVAHTDCAVAHTTPNTETTR